MDFEVNLNTSVKVKLTDVGINILKERHDELNDMIKANGGKGVGEFQLRLDENGYYTTQLWILMSVFGGDMISLHSKNPFEIDIIIRNGKAVSQ